MHRCLAWSGFLALLVLHLDSWRPQRVAIHLGWIPEELLWRLAWMLLAWAYLFYICRFHWRTDEA
jgi:hypothetical protein